MTALYCGSLLTADMPKLAKTQVYELQCEIRRTAKFRYCQRLHGVLMISTGISYEETAKTLGITTRTLRHWMRRWRLHGANGLRDARRPGRPRRLTDAQLEEIYSAVRRTPKESGVEIEKWTPAALSGWIELRYGVKQGVRQCRRILIEAERTPPRAQKAPQGQR